MTWENTIRIGRCLLLSSTTTAAVHEPQVRLLKSGPSRYQQSLFLFFGERYPCKKRCCCWSILCLCVFCRWFVNELRIALFFRFYCQLVQLFIVRFVVILLVVVVLFLLMLIMSSDFTDACTVNFWMLSCEFSDASSLVCLLIHCKLLFCATLCYTRRDSWATRQDMNVELQELTRHDNNLCLKHTWQELTLLGRGVWFGLPSIIPSCCASRHHQK